MDSTVARKVRLPNDTAGLLEDRISDDPLDFPAYEELINYLRSKSKVDEARQIFERFLKVLPGSAYVWRQYAEMEASENELNRVEALFGRALMASLHLDIWNYYLDYIRRTHPLSTGGTSARTVISQAYEFVLQHVGIDLESGPIWADYLSFLKSAAATSSWEEQQRNDQLRKVYQRAVVTPLNNVEFLWREYNSFENGINKQTARKFLNEKSPAYMTARANAKELASILPTIRAPKFPARFMRTQSEELYLANWKRWIALEKSDPLELEDQMQLRNRIKYAIKQSHMFCRFHPEVWYDAAAYYESLSELETIQEATHTKPSATLKEGLTANPDSWLLSFAFAEIEETAQRHENVKATFDTLIAKNESDIVKVGADYDNKLELARKDAVTQTPNLKLNESESDSDSEAEDTDAPDGRKVSDSKLSHQTSATLKKIEDERQQKLKQLSEEGTVAAIMYMRALRRMEGIKSARMCFANSIRSPHMSWQIYVASALMEHQYDDSRPSEKDGKAAVPIPVRIFTRGLKLFPDNHEYILEYLNFLLSIRDDKNARALFEQSTAKIDPSKARPLYKRWYQYESMYGDLTSAQKLGTRMAESDSDSSALALFGQRFSYLGCDPIARRDLGIDSSKSNTVKTMIPPIPRIPPPHPLAFFPSQDMPVPIPIPGASGFNPPMLPQYQKRASPLPVAAPPQPVVSIPIPPPLHLTLVNFLESLPPSDALNHNFTFNHQQILNIIRGLDLNKAQLPSNFIKVEQPTSRQTTPQVVPQAPSTIPAKRTAQSMIPTPDDVVALGRHNDPKDPYKKRP